MNVSVTTNLQLDGKTLASFIKQYITKGAEFLQSPGSHDDHAHYRAPGAHN